MSDTNYSHGHYAEKVAAQFLTKHGYKIIELNWKTAWCEIDIIAEKNKTIYFVEVKYRQNNDHGQGLDYITSKKLTQMARAAESWVLMQSWNGEYTLAALEVSGADYVVTEFLTDVS